MKQLLIPFTPVDLACLGRAWSHSVGSWHTAQEKVGLPLIPVPCQQIAVRALPPISLVNLS